MIGIVGSRSPNKRASENVRQYGDTSDVKLDLTSLLYLGVQYFDIVPLSASVPAIPREEQRLRAILVRVEPVSVPSTAVICKISVLRRVCSFRGTRPYVAPNVISSLRSDRTELIPKVPTYCM